MQPATFVQYNPAVDGNHPPSPCIGVCRMNTDSGLCDGCHRNIDEIMQWSSAADADKRAIWQAIQQRRRALSGG